MWVGDVFTGQYALSLVNLGVVLDNLYASATARRDGFEDPENAGVPFTLSLEKLIIFGEQVAHGRYQEVLRVLDPESVHVTPEQVLAAQLRATWEMVRLLVLVKALDVVAGDVARPLEVEVDIVAFDHIEASVFTRVHDGIVDVGRVRDFERHEQVLDLITIVLADTVSSPIEVHVARVREEGRRGPIRENRLEEVDVLGVWLKHAVRQTRFLSLDEHRVDRVLFDELRDFAERLLLHVLRHLSLLPKHPLKPIEELAIQEHSIKGFGGLDGSAPVFLSDSSLHVLVTVSRDITIADQAVKLVRENTPLRPLLLVTSHDNDGFVLGFFARAMRPR